MVLQLTWYQKIVPPQFLPFPFDQPACTVNKEKKRLEDKRKTRADKFVFVVDELVRKWMGDVECGSFKKQSRAYPFAFSETRLVGVPLEPIRKEMENQVRNRWPPNEFEQTWNLFLENLQSGDVPDGSPLSLVGSEGNRMFKTVHPAIISQTCRMKKSAFDLVMSYAAELSIAVVFLSVVSYLWNFRRRQLEDNRKVAVLVHDVLDLIHEESDQHLKDSIRHPIPGLSVSQLRDYLLPEVLPHTNSRTKEASSVDSKGRTRWLIKDKKIRDRIWKKVRTTVLRNTSVRETAMELKGDSHAVWQWVGSSTLKPTRKA